MTRHAKTLMILATAVEVLTDEHPMTVRQVFYQLLSRQVIKNNRSAYQAVSILLVNARKDGTILWEWIEDRLRKAHIVTMWDGLPGFAETVRNAYRRDIWSTQPEYVEVWLEKDALSGIFENVLEPYGVTLNVGRGFDGWSSIKEAADRYGDGENTTVLYFGDFDPSGEDMFRSLRVRLSELGSNPEIIKCALTHDDVDKYNLPPNLTKSTDTRSAAFVAIHGDISVELDALPVAILTQRLEEAVKEHMDLDALQDVLQLEKADRTKLVELLKNVGN